MWPIARERMETMTAAAFYDDFRRYDVCEVPTRNGARRMRVQGVALAGDAVILSDTHSTTVRVHINDMVTLIERGRP